MREVSIEEYLRTKVERLGGLCEKHQAPGRRGVPDRLVTFPDGHMALPELKTISGALSPPQERDHRRRAKCNVFVPVLWTKQQVAVWLIDNLKHWYRSDLRDLTKALRRDAGLDGL